MRVLYVEDDVQDADLSRRRLATAAPHIQLDIVGTQREALARLERQDAGYDVVLSDVHLPDGEGLALLAHIRANALPLAVVMISGAPSEETTVAALKAGADDYIVKRADYLEHLPLILESALQRFRVQTAQRARPLRVLYAEDNVLDIDLTRRHLARHAPHIRLEAVQSAGEVLRRLPARGASGQYDLLLLDYLLPGVNALDVLKELRQVRRLDIPVVLVTGQGNEDVAWQALKLSAEDYVVKDANYLHRLPSILENAFSRVQLTREQAALRESEARYRLISELTSDVMYSFRVEPGDVTVPEWETGALSRLTGYTWEELADTRNLFKLVHPDDLSILERHLQVLQTGKSDVAEFRIVAKSGEVLWARNYGRPVWDERQGRVVRLHGAAQDITQRRLAEDALRDSEERFRSLVQNSSDVIAILDAAATIRYVSPSVEHVVGYTPDELMGRNVLEFIHADDAQQVARLFFAAVEGRKAGDMAEFRFRHKDGSWRILSSVGTNLLDNPAVLGIVVNSRDVTERVRAEEARRESEAQLGLQSAALEAAANGILITGREGVVLWANPAVTRLTGYSAEELIGQNPRIFQSGQHDAAFYRNLWQAILAGHVWRGEVYNRRKDGSLYIEEMTITPVRALGGEVTHFIAVKQDITERKQAEEKLKQSEARFRNIIESSPMGIHLYRFDASGRLIFTGANPAADALLSLDHRRFVGKALEEAPPPPIKAQVVSDLYRVCAEGAAWHTEEMDFEDERVRGVFELHAFQTAPGMMAVMFFDVTDRRRAEQEIRRLNLDLGRRARELNALNQAGRAMTSTLNMEAVLNLVIEEIKRLVDADGASVLLRDPTSDDLIFAAAAGSGAEQQLVGKRMPVTQGVAGWVMRERQPALVNDVQSDARFYSSIDAGTGLTTHSLVAVPLKFQGTVWGVVEAVNKLGDVFTHHDIDLLDALASSASIAIENARLYSSLKRANAELQEAQRAKDEMIQNVSHELRTPLAMIYGYIELLDDLVLGSLALEQHKAVQIMHRQGDRLRFMVDRLLALQTFDAGKLHLREFDLGEWLRGFVDLWDLRAARVGVQLRLDISLDALPVVADQDSLGQVMANLLDNAFKFGSPGGQVRVRAWTECDQVILAVSDNGIGILPDHLQKIFEHFYQVDGSSTRRYGGMGIGLSLCQVIVQAHGGRIWAESEGKGQGSTFYVSLPVPPAQKA